jgi:hypothetical protein
VDTASTPDNPTRPVRRASGRTKILPMLAAFMATTVVAACSSGGDAGAPPPDAVPTTGGSTTAVPTTTVATTVDVPASVAVTTPATDAPQDEGAVPDTELLDTLLATRDPDGGMPLDSALTAFAAVYGGLPGVAAPAASPAGIEGTTAARWVTAHRDELTDDQRAAIDRAMSPLDIDGTPLPAGDTPRPAGWRGASPQAAPRSAETGCFGGTFAFADAPGAGKYRDLVARAMSELSALLGPLDIPVYTAFSEFEGVNADLNPWAPDCGQPAQACQIRLAPLAMTMADNTLLKTLAHELTHCYQARAVGATSIASLPDWLIEGFPSYVGETVGVSVGATAPNYWWDKWFKRPGVQLYERTYDALGFYAVVKQAGGDPFGHYLAALQTKASSPAFQELISGVVDHFGTIWGSTHFRQIERGLFWELDGPGATGYTPAIPASTITNGGGYSSALGEAQAESDMFKLQAEVVVVELAGGARGRYSFPGTADDALAARHEWCTLGYPCVCPDDTARAGQVVDQAPASELAVGAAGIAAGGTLAVTGMTFEDYCGPKVPTTTVPPAPPAVDACLVGSWVSGEWMIPGPPGAGIDLHGGAGIAMTIDAAGVVTTDFSGMAPMTGFIEQSQTGGLTQQITAAGGAVDELVTNRNMSIGPGVFAIWGDTTRYECGTDTFTLVAFDPIELVDIPIPFVRAG